MTSGILIALIGGLAIIAGLSWVAYRELKKVAAMEAQQQAQENERQKNLQISIDAIARAVIAEQCDVSEGALRLKPLLDASISGWADRSDLRAILTLASALADQPIKEARAALTKQERMKFDLVRMKLEAEHADSLKQACQVLIRKDS